MKGRARTDSTCGRVSLCVSPVERQFTLTAIEHSNSFEWALSKTALLNGKIKWQHKEQPMAGVVIFVVLLPPLVRITLRVPCGRWIPD